MAVTLTKLIDGNPTISDTFLYEQVVRCPRCERKYRLGYSEGEWHRVKDWLKLAVSAILKDHNLRHEVATIPLEWSGVRRRSRVSLLPMYCPKLSIDFQLNLVPMLMQVRQKVAFAAEFRDYCLALRTLRKVFPECGSDSHVLESLAG